MPTAVCVGMQTPCHHNVPPVVAAGGSPAVVASPPRRRRCTARPSHRPGTARCRSRLRRRPACSVRHADRESEPERQRGAPAQPVCRCSGVPLDFPVQRPQGEGQTRPRPIRTADNGKRRRPPPSRGPLPPGARYYVGRTDRAPPTNPDNALRYVLATGRLRAPETPPRNGVPKPGCAGTSSCHPANARASPAADDQTNGRYTTSLDRRGR
jgi:hypothetical protein